VQIAAIYYIIKAYRTLQYVCSVDALKPNIGLTSVTAPQQRQLVAVAPVVATLIAAQVCPVLIVVTVVTVGTMRCFLVHTAMLCADVSMVAQSHVELSRLLVAGDLGGAAALLMSSPAFEDPEH
jgi:hypothetical protein